MNRLGKSPRSAKLAAEAAAFVLGGLTLTAGAAQAQVLEEVIVTAQKREQSLQDVGISVTAFTGDQMARLGFVESNDLVAQTPGLEVSGFGGGALASFNIRGVGQNDFAANQEAPVALYIDEAYQSSNVSTRFSLFDIERAEVLRGPQGTLFGRNSTGGLVHFITRNPTQEFEGFIDVMVGEEARRRVEAAVGGGLSDTVSARLSFVYNADNGLMENSVGADAMEADNYAVRGQLYFELTDDLDFLLKVQYADEDAAPNGYALGLPSWNQTDFFGNVPDGDPFKIFTNFDFFQTTEIINVYGKLTWEVGQFTITSVTDYQDIEHSYGEDADASPTDAFNYTQVAEIDQISQEARVNWEGERHHSVVGFYYLNIDGEYSFDQSGAVFFGPLTFNTSAAQDTTTFAFFGQTEIDLTQQFSVILGLRYNDDEKDYVLSAPDFGFSTFTDTLEEDDFAVKAQLDYRPNDDWLLYASYSRGIKSGGFNLPLTPLAAAADLPFKGETLNAFEVGFKSSLTDSTRLNASVFYYDYNDYQAYNIDAFFNTLLFNADAEFYGAEVELFSNPVDGLDLILGASFIDTEVTGLPTDFNTLDPITFQPAQTFPTGKEDAPLTPSFTLNGLARYSWPAFAGNLAIQGDFRFVDEQKFNLATSEPVLEDSYFVMNARLEYTTENDKWTAALFVNNLTDEDYRTFSIDGTLFFGSSEDVPGLQRWVGGSVAYGW